jgi:hypothetical protein
MKKKKKISSGFFKSIKMGNIDIKNMLHYKKDDCL